MSDPSPRGRFVWHELMTADPVSAARFYSKVVGWKTEAWPQDPSYSFFTLGKSPKAGLMLLPEAAKNMGAPPHWLTYIGTASVDDTVRQAAGLGAQTLHGPADIPNIGRFAVLSDPQGAVFAVYTPMQGGGGPAGPSGIGEFSWHELATTDWQAALAFYHALFGWEKTSAMEMPGGTYQMFGVEGQSAGGIFNKPAEMPGPPSWLPYIKVADSHRAARVAGTQGGRIFNGPMEVPGGDWIAQGMDPQGAAFAVHSAKPAAAATAPAPTAKATAPAASRKKAAPAATRAKAAAKSSRKPVKAASASAKKPVKKVRKAAATRVVTKGVKTIARKAARKAVKPAVKKAVRKSAPKKRAVAGGSRPKKKSASPRVARRASPPKRSAKRRGR